MSEATPAPKKKKRKLLIILIMAAVVMLSLALALGIAIAFPPIADTPVLEGQCNILGAIECSNGQKFRCAQNPSAAIFNWVLESDPGECAPTPAPTCSSQGGICNEACSNGTRTGSCDNGQLCCNPPPTPPPATCSSVGGTCQSGPCSNGTRPGLCNGGGYCCAPTTTPPPTITPPPPGSWGACGSCNTCPTDQLHQCRTNPEGACVWDPGGCSTGGPPPGQPLECYPEDNPSSSCDGKQFNASCGTNRRCRQQSGNGWANFRPCRCVAVSTSSSSGEVVEPPPVAVPDPVVLPDTAVFEDSVLAIMTGIFLLLLGTLLAYHSEYWGRKIFSRFKTSITQLDK